MSRLLNDLNPEFRNRVYVFLAKLVEANIPITIIDTLRTQEEHEANLLKGVSWTKHSKHLDGLAIDICPYSIFNENGPDKLNWDATAQVWDKIGSIGESVGLVWGGRWKQKDMGHFEMPREAAPKQVEV